MKLISKIKTILPMDVIQLLASVCDTKRYPSNVTKMILVTKILKRYGINFSIAGGATNRWVVQVDEYVLKIAIDQQGYKDNMMEYSICKELQPYVTKSYETNGYILVQECVRLMTDDEWINRKGEILRILDELSRDYLLGDVGYIPKNKANWGIRDNGDIVILDYAYCHRATQNLFQCEVCGEGVLSYDQNYDFLVCGNRSACTARFTYNERKRIQGDQVDLDMIEERKSDSVILPGDQVEKVVNQFSGDMILGDNVVVIHNSAELEKYKEEENMPIIDYDSAEDMKEIISIAEKGKNDPEGAKLMFAQYFDRKHDAIPNRPYVLADDYTEIPTNPIMAKPMDMEYGESEEEYQERKRLEESNMADEMREDTGWGPRVDDCESLEDVIARLNQKKNSDPTAFAKSVAGDVIGSSFDLPIGGGIPEDANKEAAPSGGKVYIDGKEM